jgi:hypothetical protein
MSDKPFTEHSFREFLAAGKLMGARSRSTGQVFVPPRPINPDNYEADMEWVELSGAGKLAAYTAVHIGPTMMIEAGYDRKKPYCTGVVELAEGPMISAQILGVDPAHPETIQIGAPLTVAFIERGEGEEARTYLAFTAKEE